MCNLFKEIQNQEMNFFFFHFKVKLVSKRHIVSPFRIKIASRKKNEENPSNLNYIQQNNYLFVSLNPKTNKNYMFEIDK